MLTPAEIDALEERITRNADKLIAKAQGQSMISKTQEQEEAQTLSPTACSLK